MQPGVPRSRAAKLISLVNRYPQWFSAVDRRFLTQTSFGFAIWCDRWDVIGQTIIAKGQWEGLLSRTILALLRPADIAIDIGAKIGYDTMLMSKAVGREGKVLAFEPDLDNLALLLQNLCQLEHSNVLVQSSELLT
jgi:protein-L-isoaspartate O-methyltransferase